MSERLSPSSQYVERWGVTGDSGKEYTVARKADGAWSCSCPHHVFRKVECKHIARLKIELAHPATPVRPAQQQPRNFLPAKPVPMPTMAPEMARMKVRHFRDDEE